MLVLGNDDVARLLSMRECIAAAPRDVARRRDAAHAPRCRERHRHAPSGTRRCHVARDHRQRLAGRCAVDCRNGRAPIKRVRVYSPRAESREQFVAEARALHNVDIAAAASADGCVDGADVIMAATPSMVRVLEPAWLKAGVHVSCIKSQEVDAEVLDACDRVFMHTARQAKQMDNVMPGTPNVSSEHGRGWWKEPGRDRYPDLGQLLSGAASGRSRRDEVTCFVNNVGIGLQFAAAGALVLEKARQQGLGHTLPDDWFSEDVHP